MSENIDEVRFDLFDLTDQEIDDLIEAVTNQYRFLRAVENARPSSSVELVNRLYRFGKLLERLDEPRQAVAAPFALRRADLCA